MPSSVCTKEGTISDARLVAFCSENAYNAAVIRGYMTITPHHFFAIRTDKTTTNCATKSCCVFEEAAIFTNLDIVDAVPV